MAKLTSKTHTRMLILGFVGLVLVLAYMLRQSYLAVLARTSDHAYNLALTLDGQLVASMRRMDATLNQIAKRLPHQALNQAAASRHKQDIEAILRDYKLQFPDLRDIFVYGADGGILYDTLDAPAVAGSGNVALRPAFQLLKNDPKSRIAFTDLVRGVVSGQLTVATFVPVRDAQGNLLAAVAGSVRLEYFDQVIESLSLSPNSVAFVRRSADHKLVIRHPWIESELNRSVRNPIQARIDAGETAGREEFVAVTDGVRRIYGFRKIEGYPFYVVVGLSAESVVQSWSDAMIYVVVIVLGLALLLGLALRRMADIEAQREAARADAGKSLLLLREAINSLSIGIVIYDPRDRLVMCNEALLQLYSNVPDLFVPGRTYEEMLRDGLQRGLFLEAQAQGEAWLNRRLREYRTADGTAIEIEIDGGRWLLNSEHRTPQGYVVGSRIDITDRKRLEEELRAQASTDALTDLPNRRHFMQKLEEERERVRRRTTSEACVLMLDLDHFKVVNDQYGHAAGDALLKHFASLLQEQLRSTDAVGRLGGEEFAVILPGSGKESAKIFAERLIKALAERPLAWGAQQIRATVSIGIASLSPDDGAADAALSRADSALYRAKENGRNRVELAT